ncbi:MAG: zinc transport system permease protein [Clostridia bacterium]|jgi:zinc transport system permease protein|nr:zinc transport system permease protein [Clostridia bacterium]MDN5323477.1 zinc transport system permease protein [Clostridia bacterium]
MDFLDYSFMQRALLSGFAIGIVCPLMGMFLVLRRLSMIGDALAHVSMAGIATGLILGLNPTITALISTMTASLLIDLLRKTYSKFAEIAIAIIMAGGLGIGIILITIGGSNTANVMSYLFGSIIAISPFDLFIILIISLIILTFMIVFYNKLFFIAFDEEAARLNGIPVNFINILFMLLTAMTVAVSIKVTGILLISALMTIPVATSIQIARSFKQTSFFSILFALLSVFFGLISSFYFNWPPGGTIIVISLLILIVVLFVKKLSRF